MSDASAASSSSLIHVSTVIPVFNSQRFVHDCIQSVLEQDIEGLEVIAVDDGSTDESRTILARIAAADPRLKILTHLENKNLGVSKTREAGIRAAAGRYIALLDADDLFAPGKLRRQLQAMQERPECIVCHTAVNPLYDGPALHGPFVTADFNGFAHEPTLYRFHERPTAFVVCPICNSSTLIRADVLKAQFRAFPQLFQHEDWTLWVLLSTQGPFLFLPDRLTTYRVHADSFCATTIRDPLRPLYARVEMLLTVLAFCSDRDTAGRVSQTLQPLLVELIGRYRDGGADAGASDVFDGFGAGLADKGPLLRIQQLERELNTLKRSYAWRALKAIEPVLRTTSVLLGRLSHGLSLRSGRKVRRDPS